MIHTFVVTIEVNEKDPKCVTPEDLRLRIAGAPTYMDGVRTIDVEYQGVTIPSKE